VLLRALAITSGRVMPALPPLPRREEAELLAGADRVTDVERPLLLPPSLASLMRGRPAMEVASSMTMSFRPGWREGFFIGVPCVWRLTACDIFE
jgi:hypothetical protein